MATTTTMSTPTSDAHDRHVPGVDERGAAASGPSARDAARPALALEAVPALGGAPLPAGGLGGGLLAAQGGPPVSSWSAGRAPLSRNAGGLACRGPPPGPIGPCERGRRSDPMHVDVSDDTMSHMSPTPPPDGPLPGAPPRHRRARCRARPRARRRLAERRLRRLRRAGGAGARHGRGRAGQPARRGRAERRRQEHAAQADGRPRPAVVGSDPDPRRARGTRGAARRLRARRPSSWTGRSRSPSRTS